MGRIAIWHVEQEVGGGLPSEWRYSLSSVGTPMGWVVLPEGMTSERYADHVVLRQDVGGKYVEHVASLGTRRLVEAAVGGEFGLSWSTMREGGA